MKSAFLPALTLCVAAIFPHAQADETELVEELVGLAGVEPDALRVARRHDQRDAHAGLAQSHPEPPGLEAVHDFKPFRLLFDVKLKIQTLSLPKAGTRSSMTIS